MGFTGSKPGMWWDYRRQDPRAFGLLGYWPFWEGDGNVATDVASLGRGALTNFPANPWSDGALSFDTNDYVRTPASSVYYPPGAFTILLRLRTVHQGTFQVVFDINGNTGISIFTDTALQQVRIGMGGDSNAILSNAEVDDGEWHSIAFVARSTSYAAIYIDGVFDKSDATVTLPNFGSAAVDIGSRAGAFALFGDMDYVAMYGRELSADEIADWHNEQYRLLERPRNLSTLAAAIGGSPPAGAIPYYYQLISRQMRGVA